MPHPDSSPQLRLTTKAPCSLSLDCKYVQLRTIFGFDHHVLSRLDLREGEHQLSFVGGICAVSLKGLLCEITLMSDSFGTRVR
jgi:hypothetical protein